MVRTPTNIIPLGFIAPEFKLRNPFLNKEQSLSEIKGEKATVVVFMCNHCPFVIHILTRLVSMAKLYKDKGVNVIGINSNDIKKYPEDSPEKMVELVKKYKISFPYLFDESQDIAKEYNAACTPDFNLFNSKLSCIYRGQMDDSRPGNKMSVTGRDLSLAIEAVLKGETPTRNQKPSLGCNIKWKE